MPAKRTSGHIVQDEGTSVGQAAFLDFAGSAVSVATASGKTTVTVTSGVPDLQYESRNSNTILGVADKGKTISYSASVTQTFEADETLGDGWWIDLKNGNTGTTTVTLDPAGSETIDGLTTLVMFPGEIRRVFCNGAGNNFNSLCLDPGPGLYVEVTSSVTISSGTEGSPNDVISLGSITYDGSRILLEFFGQVSDGAGSNVVTLLCLWDTDSTELCRWGDQRGGSNADAGPHALSLYLTPSAGAHTYKVRAFRAVANGTVDAGSGSGGSGTYAPITLRATKA